MNIVSVVSGLTIKIELGFVSPTLKKINFCVVMQDRNAHAYLRVNIPDFRAREK